MGSASLPYGHEALRAYVRTWTEANCRLVDLGEKIHVSLMPGTDVMAVTAKYGDGARPPIVFRVESAGRGVTCASIQRWARQRISSVA